MKSLIFGIAGQDGQYLSRLLSEKGARVLGVSRSDGDWLKGDVSDTAFVEKLIDEHKPDHVFHLAANSTTRHDAAYDHHHAISTGTLNILESARSHSPGSRIFLSGSAMQFKNTGQPIDESTPFEASSYYSVARIHATYAGRYYRDAFGLRVYTGYFFNHDSPLRSERHVNQKIVAAVNRIAAGSAEVLELGNLEVRKEFNFAGDIVEAVWTLVNQDTVFEAVLGSGRAYRIADWVEYCFSAVHRSWTDHVKLIPGFKPEYEVLVSNPALIGSLGWSPRVDFQQFADLMLQGDRDRRL